MNSVEVKLNRYEIETLIEALHIADFKYLINKEQHSDDYALRKCNNCCELIEMLEYAIERMEMEAD